MSKWITTGQMVDTMQIGQIAEADTKADKNYVKRTLSGFFWCDKNGKILDAGEILHLSSGLLKIKWNFI